MNDMILHFMYKNYKGEYSYRNVLPDSIVFEYNNPYHGDGYILRARDMDKNAEREFCFNDILKGTIRHTLEMLDIDSDESIVDSIFEQMEK